MLQRALPYRAAFASIRWMERSASTFHDLPTDEEWSRIEGICDLLLPFDEITNIISGTKYPTANLSLRNGRLKIFYYHGLLLKIVFLGYSNKDGGELKTIEIIIV